jgi:dTDP-4-amino-4,6-dideoxygalactose transaminase
MIPSLDLKRQYERLLKTEIDKAILDVCKSGMFCLGENLKAFEEEIAQYVKVKHAIGVNSGSASLILALEALGIGQGDEVIVPANTYIATVFAVSHVGATPVFVDHDEYYNIDPQEIVKKITDKTKAVIVVHLYGQPCKMNMISKIVKDHNLLLVEDCAQAIGAEYEGQKIGSFGDAACFSFYPGKNLGAYGDGGVILTNRDDVEKKLRMLRNDGQSAKYTHDIIGYNERLDEIQAAVLRVKLRYLDDWNRKRANIAVIYRDLIKAKELNIVLPKVMENVKHVYHQFVIQVENRDEVRKILWEKYKIGTGIHYPKPVHKQKAYEAYNNVSCLNSEKNAPKLLSLPMFPELCYLEAKFVVEKLEEILK